MEQTNKKALLIKEAVPDAVEIVSSYAWRQFVYANTELYNQANAGNSGAVLALFKLFEEEVIYRIDISDSMERIGAHY